MAILHTACRLVWCSLYNNEKRNLNERPFHTLCVEIRISVEHAEYRATLRQHVTARRASALMAAVAIPNSLLPQPFAHQVNTVLTTCNGCTAHRLSRSISVDQMPVLAWLIGTRIRPPVSETGSADGAELSTTLRPYFSVSHGPSMQVIKIIRIVPFNTLLSKISSL